ncbi:hypothetical protein ACIBH1_16260 [Nonomuraea sp. NPDC050663]|uniref:hypothetical protein n=1 Tax=Nonomuraea sp. NPDC050663 TaxID=3364370 RepID=UPI0037A0A1E0
MLVDNPALEAAIAGAVVLVLVIGWVVRARRRGGVRVVVNRHRAGARAQLDAMDQANLRRHGVLPFAIWLAGVPLFTVMTQAIDESGTALRIAVLPVTALLVAVPLFEVGWRPFAAILGVSRGAKLVVGGTAIWIFAFLVVPQWLTGPAALPYILGWGLALLVLGFVHAARSKARLGDRLMPSPWLK